MTKIAAIDQGTTSTRILLSDSFAPPPRIIHAVKHAQFYPQPGWVEHDPEELLRNIKTCLAAVGPVDAIGLANQGESCLAWDAATGAPLSPVIVWQDNRTAAWLETRRDAAPEILRRAGLPLDAYFSAAKFSWILQNIPQARAAGAKLRLGTTDAFFLDRLTGTFATDVTTASRTSLMHLQTRQWDPELCRIFGIPIEALPEIRDSCADFGTIDGIPVRASMVDQQAALYGHGCRNQGDAKITFGTGAFALAVTGRRIILQAAGQGLLPTIAWSRNGVAQYAVDGGVYDAGAAVEWGQRLGLFGNFAELDGFAAPPAITRKLAFVPALSGLACPHWDRTAAALWIGMDAGTTKRDMAQALLEGISLRTAEVVAAMHAEVPITGKISIDGGLTRSRYFTQFLANALQRELLLPCFDELSAFGCAAMAGSTAPLPGGAQSISPNIANVAAWHEVFSQAVKRSQAWR